MFASCFPDLIEQAKHVIITCEPRLSPLFARSFPKASVYSIIQARSAEWQKDGHIPSTQLSTASLPHLYRRHIQDFPGHSGYLQADSTQTLKWLERYRQLDHPLNIGISWRGGQSLLSGMRRTPLDAWTALLRLPGVNFINLQYGDVHDDLEHILSTRSVPVHHWQDSDPLKDMDDFASQIAALDMVISVDNSTVHLSGALGIPTWILQPFRPDWRWMQQSTNSYWYPSVRQFHPDTPEDWATLIDKAASQLQEHIGNGLIKRHESR